MSKPQTKNMESSFSNSYKTTENGCWEWIKSKYQSGYGQAYNPLTEKCQAAHRKAWEIFNGPIPKGMLVLHKCDNPPCVNPGHLFLGTYKDNTHDMLKKGRQNYKKSKYIKNKYLENKIKSEYISIYQFSEKFDLSKITLYEYIRQVRKPLTKNQTKLKYINRYYFKESAMKISKALQCSILEIFPPTILDEYVKPQQNDNLIRYSERKLQLSILSTSINPKSFDKLFCSLKDREKNILLMRFGWFGKEKTLEEIGKGYGITRERVRQIEQKAIRKIRHKFRLFQGCISERKAAHKSACQV